MRRIIYDGDSFYELDEECMRKKEEEERQKEMEWQRQNTDLQKTNRNHSSRQRR